MKKGVRELEFADTFFMRVDVGIDPYGRVADCHTGVRAGQLMTHRFRYCCLL